MENEEILSTRRDFLKVAGAMSLACLLTGNGCELKGSRVLEAAQLEYPEYYTGKKGIKLDTGENVSYSERTIRTHVMVPEQHLLLPSERKERNRTFTGYHPFDEPTKATLEDIPRSYSSYFRYLRLEVERPDGGYSVYEDVFPIEGKLYCDVLTVGNRKGNIGGFTWNSEITERDFFKFLGSKISKKNRMGLDQEKSFKINRGIVDEASQMMRHYLELLSQRNRDILPDVRKEQVRIHKNHLENFRKTPFRFNTDMSLIGETGYSTEIAGFADGGDVITRLESRSIVISSSLLRPVRFYSRSISMPQEMPEEGGFYSADEWPMLQSIQVQSNDLRKVKFNLEYLRAFIPEDVTTPSFN